MKKPVWIALVVGFIVALAFPVSNLLVKPANGGVLADLRPNDASFAAVAGLLEDRCAGCHVADVELPFYAALPVAKRIIDRDIEKGMRHLDLRAAMQDGEAPVPEVTLAKIEHSVERGSMPPAQYKLLHWDAGLGDEERRAILEWTRGVRRAHYASGVAAGDLADAVVRPLVAPEGLDDDLVALGDRLFHDNRLSGDDTVSCATCHDLAKGGTDQLRFSEGIRGQFGGINAPTVYNAGLMIRQFWDGRAADLAEQAGGPVTNPIEMGAAWADVLAKLEGDGAYVDAFGKLFPDGITQANVQTAIAAFEETLVTTGSRFDAYLTGDEEALDAEEKAGLELFANRGCRTCHVGPALGGQSFEYMGLHASYFDERGEVNEADYGLYNFTKKEADRFKFKVPTLRNIAVTWPYFHDGSTDDLTEAVRVMGRCQCEDGLAEDEVESIAAFLNTLTGEYRGELLK